ncbi:hypothetical protein H2200_006451 [Cladophialophora chaetospira]|uniref:Uncharacterized protein n=1 Tax=Cladophialophora chaetospira TaxID=386627 RepID=A0AA38X8D2_9EURO|nr:hypothetical protein H2200_006451 [Cladophialophora chaetospira]
MGDAGPPTPDALLQQEAAVIDAEIGADQAPPLREVKVLVTGFGPFKSFLINPSWLIASALPDELYPSTPSDSKSPPYKITLIVHPSAIRVSYSTVSTVVPALLATHNPDFILHIGMAGGRDCYSLETRGHRDNYRIKDVDDADGMTWGEQRWKREGIPEILYVGWNEAEVLRRWEDGVKTGLAARGFLGRGEMQRAIEQQQLNVPPMPARGNGPMNLMWGTGNVPVSPTKADEHRRRAVVKLSADAGRFLCEYALFESLSRRWVEARNIETVPTDRAERETAQDAPGKVAFLHVPGWTGVEDINRGVMVAEEAIRALVGSWEDGYRRNGRVEAQAYTQQHSEEKGRVAASFKA